MANMLGPGRVSTQEEFLQRLEGMLHHGTAPVAVAVSDLDQFTAVNATHGNEAGDRVLVAWEQVLAGSLPADGVVARLGGDEYVTALPGLSAESALILMDEVRNHFVAHGVEGVEVPLNASIGVAANPPHGTSAADLFRAAGQALMRGKRDGRGRVTMYMEEKMTLKTNYYSRAALDRLARLSAKANRTEASLLREALDDLLDKHRLVT
jgi:diguanylate cyclase (GGDEF)-like protein